MFQDTIIYNAQRQSTAIGNIFKHQDIMPVLVSVTKIKISVNIAVKNGETIFLDAQWQLDL